MTDLIIDNGVLAKAEIDTQIATAKAYPRNQKTFVDRAIEMATMDQDTAESCFYSLVRNGKDGKTEIKGASIRLAEIVASCWGNIHAATRVTENNGKFITAQGVCWDLESNVKMSAEVKRSIQTKNGQTYGTDMQVVTGNAACSIALRNAILKVIPKALVDRIYNAAVSYSVGDQKTIDHKRKAVFERFNKMGIESAKILAFFDKEAIEEFNSEDIATLIGIGTSIKEGITPIDKAFSLDDTDDKNVEDKIKSLLENKDA